MTEIDRARAEFDALVQEATQAAATLQGSELDAALAALDEWVNGLPPHLRVESLLKDIRVGLVRFRRLCSFLGESLGAALNHAAGDATPHRGYGRSGALQGARARGLLKGYG